MIYGWLCALFIVGVRGLAFRATTSNSPIDAAIQDGAQVVGRAGTYFVVCAAYDQLSTPAIFKTRPRSCQIVTYGCSCINSRAYYSNASSWIISPIFNECFVTRIPDVKTAVSFVWIASVSKLQGSLCDISELTYMYTNNAEGSLTVNFLPL